MLNYQSTSFHDALYARRPLGFKHAPEFADWLAKMQIIDPHRHAAAHRRPPSAAVRPAARSLRMNRPDAWNPLREFTDASDRPGRSGASLPTREVLNFGLAHARARDAIHQPSASQQLADAAGGARPRRPDGAQRRAGPSHPSSASGSGRQLADESRADLAASGVRPADLLLVIGDGLSSWR